MSNDTSVLNSVGRFTDSTATVVRLALREALQLGHNTIEPHHLLLALIRHGDGIAADTLMELGGDLPKVRQLVMQKVLNCCPTCGKQR